MIEQDQNLYLLSPKFAFIDHVNSWQVFWIELIIILL